MPEEEVEAEVVESDELDHRPAPGLDRSEVVEANLVAVRDELYRDALFTLDAAMRWSEIEPGDKYPPPEWVTDYGQEKADKMFRIAKEAMKPTREMAGGLKMTVELWRGLEQARATDKLGGVFVGVQVVVNPDVGTSEVKIVESTRK